MGLIDRIRTLAAAQQATPPYADAPAVSPVDQTLGHTAPEPDATEVRPRVGQRPIGDTGRANFYGLPQPDETNRQLVGAQGLRNFDLMYRTDPDIRRLVLMSWSPIVAATWTLEPYGGDDASDQDRQIAETIWWGLNNFMSPNFIEHLNEVGPLVIRSGFTPFEQVWAQTSYKGKSLILPRKLHVRLPRSIWRWWQDDFGELTHIGQILPNRAQVVIPATELVYYRLGSEGDNWVGTSLLRHAYKSWVMKDRLERIDAIGQERKAVGVPIIYPPEGASDDDRSAVETIFASLHTNEVGYVVMPGPHAQDLKDLASQQGWRVEIVTFDSSSGPGIQESLKYHRDGIAAAFLGDFMQLGHHQVGARATADVQEDPFLTAVDALASMIIPPLDKLVARITEMNWATAEGPPKFRVNIHDSASLSEIATYVQQLVQSGAMQVDPELEDWLRERADLPPANADVRAQRQQAQQAAMENAAKAAGEPDETDAEAEPPNPDDPANPKKPASAGGKQLDAEPTVKWWENLLSQDRLRDALAGARTHIETSVRAPALAFARKQAHQAMNAAALSDTPPRELVDAFTQHFEGMYRLGEGTVRDELARQRRVLKLDGPADAAAAAAIATRIRRVRQRGEHAAQQLVQAVNGRLRQRQISEKLAPGRLQVIAERTATGALHTAALDYTSSLINDGRAAGALADSAVVGAYYTSVLDERRCDPCATLDNGQLLTVDDAMAIGPPNPECDGGDRCRCALVWVLADDPAAMQAAFAG